MTQAEQLDRADSAAEDLASAGVASEPKPFAQVMDESLLKALGVSVLDEEEPDDLSPAGEEEESPDTAALDTAELPDEPDAAQDETPSDDRLKSWVADVGANASNLDRIPPRFHKAVVDALITEHHDVNRMAVEQATRQAYEAGRNAERQITAALSEVARLDTMADEEPEEFIRWQRQFPDRATAYFNIKQQQAGGQVAPPAQPTENPYVAQARLLFAKLDGHPEAYQRIAAKAAQLRPDADGISQLNALVVDELVELKAAAGKKPDPAAQQLEQRRKAQQERAAVPRPQVGAGRGSAPVELPEDPMTLIAQGFREDLKRSGVTTR